MSFRSILPLISLLLRLALVLVLAVMVLAIDWGGGVEQILEEYVEGRAEELRKLGIIPTERKKISVSMHYFATHPFGRDYRQDVVSV